MADATIELLKVHFRQLRLPSMCREFERLARDAAATDRDYFEFLLSLTESELATRAAAAVERRIKEAKFPILKDFEKRHTDCTGCSFLWTLVAHAHNRRTGAAGTGGLDRRTPGPTPAGRFLMPHRRSGSVPPRAQRSQAIASH
jgi:IstB-like ATP binding protein